MLGPRRGASIQRPVHTPKAHFGRNRYKTGREKPFKYPERRAKAGRDSEKQQALRKKIRHLTMCRRRGRHHSALPSTDASTQEGAEGCVWL